MSCRWSWWMSLCTRLLVFTSSRVPHVIPAINISWCLAGQATHQQTTTSTKTSAADVFSSNLQWTWLVCTWTKFQLSLGEREWRHQQQNCFWASSCRCQQRLAVQQLLLYSIKPRLRALRLIQIGCFTLMYGIAPAYPFTKKWVRHAWPKFSVSFFQLSRRPEEVRLSHTCMHTQRKIWCATARRQHHIRRSASLSAANLR